MQLNEKINLCIIELDFHFDLLDSLLRIFDDSNYNVNVFTTKKNMTLLKGIKYNEAITFHIYDSFSKYLFLRKNKTFFQEADIIFINTIATDFGSYYALQNPSKIIFRVHNINKQFNPNNSVIFPNSPGAIWKFCSYFMRQIVFKLYPVHRRIINKRFLHFTFADEGLNNYVLEQKFLPKQKVLQAIPFKIFSSPVTPANFTEVMNVTIIGAIDRKRRDYGVIVDALSLLYDSNNSNVRLNLTFLGNSNGEYGTTIKQQISQINHPNLTCTFYNQQVEETEFVSVMNDSHLIISPIIEFAKAEIYKEVYGKTKTSGSILDFMKFGITTLVPSYYSPPQELSEYLIRYHNAESLSLLLQNFGSNPESLNLLNKSSKEFASKNYSKKEVFSICHTIFTGIKNNGDV